MAEPFFPDAAFGWTYLIVLAVLLGVASFLDLSFAIIPKWLTLSLLPCGILVNAVRIGWLAHLGMATWQLPTGSALLGAIDGLLFSVAGCAVGFALFFVLWILGICGGGDVKLFAALGAWIGGMLAIRVLICTIFVVGLLILAQAGFLAITGNWRRLRKRAPAASAKPKRRLITFALPLTFATLIVLAWTFRFELRLLPPRATVVIGNGVAHDCQS